MPYWPKYEQPLIWVSQLSKVIKTMVAKSYLRTPLTNFLLPPSNTGTSRSPHLTTTRQMRLYIITTLKTNDTTHCFLTRLGTSVMPKSSIFKGLGMWSLVASRHGKQSIGTYSALIISTSIWNWDFLSILTRSLLYLDDINNKHTFSTESYNKVNVKL